MNPNISKHQARRLALQFLHQLDAQQGTNMHQLDSFLLEFGDEPKSREIARKWIIGTWHSLDKIDKLIVSSSSNWDIKRISPVDRNNLRLAIHQLMDCPDIPPKVVINEAIELAKVFSTLQAPKFVNGVLDAIQRQIQSDSNENNDDDNPDN